MGLQVLLDSDDDPDVPSGTSRPRIRAGVVQANLESLADLGSGVEAAVVDALGPDTMEEIERTTRIGWLPVEVDVVMSNAVLMKAGRDATVAWVRATLEATFASPLYANFVGPTLRLFGFGPEGMLKMAPRLLGQTYRDLGRLEVLGTTPGERCVRLTGGPGIIVDDDMYLWGLGECIRAALLVVDVRGEAEHRRVGPGHAEWHIRWPTRE